MSPLRRLRALWGPAIPFLLLLAPGCAGSEASQPTATEPSVTVRTVTVESVAAPRLLRLTGTLRGARETDLAANVSGRVTQTQVERGQRVTAGTTLVQVDTAAARLALEEAQVGVESSRTLNEIHRVECERYKRLLAEGAVTQQEYERITTPCQTAPLEIEAARTRERMAAKTVGDGSIRAPFTGVVTERYVDVGEYLQPASRIVALAQVDELKLVFSVPEKHFAQVKSGATVELEVAAYPDRTFAGRVSHVSGAVRETRDVVVEASVPNPDGALLPGMFATLRVTVGQDELPAVPPSAIVADEGKETVFVVRDGRLEQRVIASLAPVGERVPVGRGLVRGERVALGNLTDLKNGQRVK